MTRSLRVVSSTPPSRASAQAPSRNPLQSRLGAAPRRAGVTAAGRRMHQTAFAMAVEAPDPYELNAHMPDRWSAWIKAHFRRPEEAAVAFGVTCQAARYWFEGLHKPTGATLLIAVDRWGGEFVQHMTGRS